VISLTFFFFFLIAFMAVIGAMRGWAKELLVTVALILALALLTALETYIPFFREAVGQTGGQFQFWVRTIVTFVLVFFGYQTPSLSKVPASKFARERIQDWMLGFVLGALNGYLIVGTLWFFMDHANYPFDPLISAPIKGTPMGDAALRILPFLPPRWLGMPWIIFAVILAGVFLIIVFL
jgi:uncharacterized membrane protein required for colicin V production